MDSINDLIRKKVQALDLDQKKSELDLIQAEFDRLYNAQVRAVKINLDRTVYVTTRNAVLAGEMRYQQAELLSIVNSVVKEPVTGFRIVIR